MSFLSIENTEKVGGELSNSNSSRLSSFGTSISTQEGPISTSNCHTDSDGLFQGTLLSTIPNPNPTPNPNPNLNLNRELYPNHPKLTHTVSTPSPFSCFHDIPPIKNLLMNENENEKESEKQNNSDSNNNLLPPTKLFN